MIAGIYGMCEGCCTSLILTTALGGRAAPTDEHTDSRGAECLARGYPHRERGVAGVQSWVVLLLSHSHSRLPPAPSEGKMETANLFPQ